MIIEELDKLLIQLNRLSESVEVQLPEIAEQLLTKGFISASFGIVIGILFGVCAFGFARLVRHAEPSQGLDKLGLVICVSISGHMLLIGIREMLAIYFHPKIYLIEQVSAML